MLLPCLVVTTGERVIWLASCFEYCLAIPFPLTIGVTSSYSGVVALLKAQGQSRPSGTRYSADSGLLSHVKAQDSYLEPHRKLSKIFIPQHVCVNA